MNQNTPRRAALATHRAAFFTPLRAALFLLLSACTQILFAQHDSSQPRSDSSAPTQPPPPSLAPTQPRPHSSAPTKPRPMGWKDIPSWKYISSQNANLSPDGKWFAYPLITTEGDGELIIKSTADTSTRRYPIGGVNQASFAFSEDGQWIAYKQSPAYKETKAAAKTPGRQLFDKLFIVNLATGKSTAFEKAGDYAFNGKAATCLAVSLVREKAAGAKPDDPKSNDLLLIELKTGKIQDIGSVGEFMWNKPGAWLAYTTETAGKTGNGLYLLSVDTRQTTVLDNDKMTYKSLSWKEEGDAFAVLKMKKDSGWKTDKGIVIGIKDLGPAPKVVVYDPAKDSAAFPKRMTVSGNRAPRWSDDLSRLFFGIAALSPEKKRADSGAKKDADTVKPDMIIWNGHDTRLQSRQQIEETQDKEFSWYGMLDVAANHFVRLSDSTQRILTPLPKTHYALVEDRSAYELDNNLDGQTYEDIYIVDLATGHQKKWLEKFYLPSGASAPKSSPDGKKLVYGSDGQYYVYDIPSDHSVDITEKIPASFVNTEDDHNVQKPLTPVLGWSSDSKWLLIHDLWDIWQIPITTGTPAVNLTRNGRTEHLRYQFRYVLDPEEKEKGIDITQPLYISMYGEWTKKSGIGRITPCKGAWQAGVEPLVWEDAGIGSLSKAKHAPVYAFSREDFSKPTEFFVGGPLLKDAVQSTRNAPLAARYTFSAGVRLVNYVSDKGDSLQGALFLPAGYEQGKKYPTIVYYYEKLSQSLHVYVRPDYSRTGWNPTMYTSNGYAVFIPDIVYKLNDPGMSAVWCVIPGVKAAIQTGVIDEQHIGIHGHSWGGYQTAFLVTQTDMFRAAAAGAPLTDMISMYDMIYWNAGVGDMAIFEASQGRLTSGPWDNWDAYRRNSPVYHVKDVKTPLLILHNDKDGAVDFEQGIEYYNALRRLKKPVTMITYRGENHGLAKRENMRDYSIRMMEFFDYYLKGKPAPEWWIKGIDRVDMDDELERRLPGADGQSLATPPSPLNPSSSSPLPRIAIAGLGIESSTFSPARTDEPAFHSRYGSDVFSFYPFMSADSPLRKRATWIPTLVGHALPGGTVTREAYESLVGKTLDSLRRNAPIDGLFLDIHGAMSVVGLDDPEGDLIVRIRKVVGKKTIISTSMDLHGNVSLRLAENTDLITCYRMAPHEDAMQTKERAVDNLLARIESGKGKPRYKAWIPIPILLPGEKTSTRIEPAKSVYAAVAPAAAQPGIIDAAIWVGYAWADEPRNHAVVMVTGDDKTKVVQIAQQLAMTFWNARSGFAFVAPTGDLKTCLDKALASTKHPYFISDSGDNPTAGGAGDVTWTLQEILARPEFDSANGPSLVYASIPGPDLIKKAIAAGVGGHVDGFAGAAVDARYAPPVHIAGTVQSIVYGDKDAEVETVIRDGSVRVIVTQKRKPYHTELDFTRLGLHPRQSDIVVVKIGYLEPELYAMRADWMMALTPGGVDQDLHRLPYKRIQRPMFPLDQAMPDPDLSARLVASSDAP